MAADAVGRELFLAQIPCRREKMQGILHAQPPLLQHKFLLGGYCIGRTRVLATNRNRDRTGDKQRMAIACCKVCTEMDTAKAWQKVREQRAASVRFAAGGIELPLPKRPWRTEYNQERPNSSLGYRDGFVPEMGGVPGLGFDCRIWRRSALRENAATL